MGYETIDNIIEKWAFDNDLKWARMYQGYPVRSTDLVDSNGNKYQIWLDEPTSDARIRVHIWNYKKLRRDFEAAPSSLSDVLDQAKEAIQGWWRDN